jgi:prevent-host-death family protein
MARISVTDAKSQLTDLVRRAEAGEEVVLTRHDKPVVEIKAVRPELTPEERREKRRRVISEVQALVAAKKLPPGPNAAHSADFLYGDDGLPK